MSTVTKIPENFDDFPKICAICKNTLDDTKTEDIFAIEITRVSRCKSSPAVFNAWEKIVKKVFGLCSIINDAEETPDELICVKCYMKILSAITGRAAEIIFESTGEESHWLPKR